MIKPMETLDRPKKPQFQAFTHTKICGIPASPQAREFCEFHALENAVCQAQDLIRVSFQRVDHLNLQTEHDPETGEAWLVVDFTLQGDVSRILKEHENFTRKWAASAPRENKGLVRIEFNIL